MSKKPLTTAQLRTVLESALHSLTLVQGVVGTDRPDILEPEIREKFFWTIDNRLSMNAVRIALERLLDDAPVTSQREAEQAVIAALLRYVQHEVNCTINDTRIEGSPVPCSCGLREAIAAASQDGE